MKHFIVYDALGNILRTGVCPDVDFSSQANIGEFIMEGSANDLTQMVDTVSLEIIQKPPAPYNLGNEQSKKSAEISVACRLHIYGGFESSALGTVHHYPANDRDQSNMIASVTDSYNPDNLSNWTTLFWCRDANAVWDLVPHTAQQIRKAGADGKRFIEAAILKNAQLQAQIQQATNESELNVIAW
jgi:hypothetical protein